MKRVRFSLGVASLVALLFVSGVVFAPDWFRQLCFPICHQKVERTLSGVNGPMAVCSRCSGIYFGAAAGLLLAALTAGRLWWPHRFWFFAGILPMAIDAMLPWVGLPQLSIVPRHMLAWPAGFIAAWFFALGLAEIVRRPAALRWKWSPEVQDG